MFTLVEFETVADAGGNAGAPAGSDPSPTAPAAPAATAPTGSPAEGGEPVTPPAGATEPAPAWSPEQLQGDPGFRDFIAQEAAQIAEQRLSALLEQFSTAEPAAGQGQDPNAGLAALDPFSDDFGQALDQRFETMLARVEQMVGQVAQPLQQQMQQANVAEGEQRIQDMIADDVARNGDFPRAPGETESKAQQLVQPLAEVMFNDIAARYGNTPRAVEIAIQQASATVRGIIAEAGAAAIAEHTNRLAGLAGAHGEPAAGAVGAQGVPDTLDPGEITRRYARNGQALQQVQ